MAYSLPIVYLPGGIDLRLPETLHEPTKAIDGLNFDITPSSDLVKRTGFSMKAVDTAGYGLINFEKRTVVLSASPGFGDLAFGQDAFGSPTTLGFGEIAYELVGLAQNPVRWKAGTLEITYSGAGSADISIQASGSDTIQCILRVDGTAVLTQDLGIGTEGSPTTVSDLATAVSAVSDFAASVTAGTSTTPAAFLDWCYQTAIVVGTPGEVYFGEWETIPSPLGNPLPAVDSRKGRAGFENPTSAAMDGILYISNGYDPMVKYDTQNIYKAGLPQAQTPTLSLSATTVAAGFSGAYTYKCSYVHVDKLGNTFEGRISDVSSSKTNSAGPYAIDVTLTNILQADGYNCNAAITNGTHTSTNVSPGIERLTVDDGSGGAHTLIAGDIAYLYDKTTAAYQSLTVDAVTSTTVDLESATTISVDDNQPISNQLKIAIYRTEAGGTLHSLVAEIPNDPFASTQVYTDTLIDASLGAEEISPSKTPALPPKCKYSTVWRNQLIMAGDPTQPTRVYYSEFSDSISPENFPATNFFEVSPGAAGGPLTGMAVLGRNLVLFTEDTTYIVEGNLASDQIRVDVISDNVGCVAHHSISVIDTAVYFLSKKGVYRLAIGGNGMVMRSVSQALDPVFRAGANNDFRDSFKRAVATSWDAQRKYILFVPDATTLGGEHYAKDTSRCYVLDLEKDEWYIWSNIKALGGMVEFDDGQVGDVIWFHTREKESSTVKRRLKRFNNTKTEIDYADHEVAVSFEYRPQWEFQNSPKTRKMYKEVSIDAFRLASDLAFTPTGTMTVDVYRDFDRDTSEASFTFDFLANDQEIIKALPRSVRRSIGMKFSNSTINEQVLISGWAFETFNFIRQVRR